MDSAGRYRLTLTIDGRAVAHGWWHSLATAERKFASEVGEYGHRATARITLVDTETGEVLKSWPADQAASASGAG
ncbi:hypothetical protein [Streptomyces indicus]|uniref:Uncharacterized protein n=1 Tax=Streptomyces indicus TaxID=417292 RepID=A0A1G9IQE6_9ACTN|nr:hypothetical protein [Streptomyces indicus]SDL27390.1 hypothetical protein SAMN05421806_1256 [Streptomyces indicus]